MKFLAPNFLILMLGAPANLIVAFELCVTTLLCVYNNMTLARDRKSVV